MMTGSAAGAVTALSIPGQACMPMENASSLSRLA